MGRAALAAARGLVAGAGAELARWPVNLRVGAAIVGAIVLAGILAPFLTAYDPYYQDYMAVLLPPSPSHPFGTDMVGRDVFTRVLYGIRIDLQIGFVTTYVPMIYGVALGAFAGYFGGWFDAVLGRVLDTAIAFPFLVLIIVIIAILGPGVESIYIAIFLVGWTMYARLARAEMLVQKGRDYIIAARALGFGSRRIVFRHALPNIVTSSIVFSMADFVLNILLVTALSFLGLGVPPPEPEWGSIIAEGRDYIFTAWWITTLPGLMIVLAGGGLSLIGDGLAQRLGERREGFL